MPDSNRAVRTRARESLNYSRTLLQEYYRDLDIDSYNRIASQDAYSA
jgi:hypothetical protein